MREDEDKRIKNPIGHNGVEAAFANQIAYCRANDAPITARIVAALLEIIREPASEFTRRIATWGGHALADALPLRAAAAIHALHLDHKAADLGLIYADASGVNDAAIVEAICRRFDTQLLPWLDGPPQTNESARSANFIAAMLWLVEKDCPPRFEILEIGSSAGINLMMDHFHYDLGGVHIGPNPAELHFQPEWRGAPPPRHALIFERLIGCDIAPVDLMDDAQAARLKAYIWPEHHQRFSRLEAAMIAAKKGPPKIIAAKAADFLQGELAQPQAEGTTRALVHSIVWQYIPEAEQLLIEQMMEEAGQKATMEKPLAWIRLEANRTVHLHELTVRHWPKAPAAKLLAHSHPHGAWINWLAA